jgi:hypothetical protein
MIDFNFLIQSFGWLFIVVFFALLVWSIIWKGLALWKAAKNGDTGWFIVFLVVNTAGILEILYIYVFGRKKSEQTNARF